VQLLNLPKKRKRPKLKNNYQFLTHLLYRIYAALQPLYTCTTQFSQGKIPDGLNDFFAYGRGC